ncbi:MAG: hypothetical protein AAFR64_09520 [Pseudomonadota bacterium]
MEQALVFASIVLGVAVASELNNLHRLLQSRKVTWHWAQPLYALLTLLTIMAFWWILARADLSREITLAGFLPAMWVLVLLNLKAAVALPDTIPEEGVNLAEYYQDKRRYMWGLYILAFAPMVGFTAIRAAQMANGLGQFIQLAGPDLLGLALILLLFFARGWWLIALGYAGFLTLATVWLFRPI